MINILQKHCNTSSGLSHVWASLAAHDPCIYYTEGLFGSGAVFPFPFFFLCKVILSYFYININMRSIMKYIDYKSHF
jgi:hypothetical protein